MTSPMPSVKEFDVYGEPCYANETRRAEDIRCVQAVQEGIFDYFRTYRKLCQGMEGCVDKKLDEVFLSLIHKIAVLDKDFIGLKVEDPFFNRMTEVVDLM